MQKRIVIFCLALLVGATSLMAQLRPRDDDHFWRRKVVNRIDLNEKINLPLTKRESIYYNDENQETFPKDIGREGLVMALFNGLKSGRFVAWHPDSLSVALSYDDVLARIQKFDGDIEGDGGFDEGFDEGGDDFEDFGGDDDFGDDFGDDEWGFDEGGDEFGESTDDLEAGGSGFAGDFDPAPFENVIQFVEDRIFDKMRSDMVYDVQYIEIIWTDPGETLPEKNLCTFKYTDPEVKRILELSQWKNRFNDAEYRTMREVFEMRLFHSFIINVSGEGVTELEEAEQRRQQLVEFEHYLWSY
ncbi:MAG: hypothetical protein AB8F95_22755 [Bacteroidia bacterium]